MKIRWYHWMVYRLFFTVWTPIFKNNPQLTRYFVDHMEGYMQQNHGDVASKWNDHLGQYWNTMKDFFDHDLKLGDDVAVVKRNILIPAQIVDFTARQIRVVFDAQKYSWAVGYGYKYGAKKGTIPTFLVYPHQTVKKPVDTSNQVL